MNVVAALIGVALVAPILALFGAIITGAVLCVPLMVALHFLHTFVPIAPALGWKACFWLIAAVRLLLPSGGSSSSKKD